MFQFISRDGYRRRWLRKEEEERERESGEGVWVYGWRCGNCGVVDTEEER